MNSNVSAPSNVWNDAEANAEKRRIETNTDDNAAKLSVVWWLLEGWCHQEFYRRNQDEEAHSADQRTAETSQDTELASNFSSGFRDTLSFWRRFPVGVIRWRLERVIRHVDLSRVTGNITGPEELANHHAPAVRRLPWMLLLDDESPCGTHLEQREPTFQMNCP